MKNHNFPLHKSESRSISAQKPGPTQIVNFMDKSIERPTTANRLIQKRQSVERKIEVKRKQKLEAELKEVQSKPTISNRSRKIAEKAESKITPLPKQRDNSLPKQVTEEDIREIEKDIQLLESCLNLKEKDKRVSLKNFEEQKVQIFESQTCDHTKKDSSKNERKSEPSSKPMHSKPPSVKRKLPASNLQQFPKSKSPLILKHRSSSIEHLPSFSFAYRSLSPYHVSIKRTSES